MAIAARPHVEGLDAHRDSGVDQVISPIFTSTPLTDPTTCSRQPLSARSLALALGAELSTITDVLEPPLVRLGLMMVNPGGRLIIDPGSPIHPRAFRW
ncbi:MAG: hypothetical protein KA354_23795 [Phycisphaerae bacterium]|nr:hypothetical protein [Phycisphaerae bacterium]